MRSEAIKVKKPSWVRIVNPDPIEILGMSWSYGSYVRIAPDGVFRTLTNTRPRTLAMYQPPHAPSEQDDAPPDALVLYTPAELRLLAEGQLSFNEPFEGEMPRWTKDAPAAAVQNGDRAFVPLSRMVKAVPPHLEQVVCGGSIYREEWRVERLNRLTEWHPIRPGGTMTAFTFLGSESRSLLKVLYRANPDYRGDQCPSGYWFDIPEAEFIRMRDLAAELRDEQELERAIVVSMLRSLT